MQIQREGRLIFVSFTSNSPQTHVDRDASMRACQDDVHEVVTAYIGERLER